MVEVRRQNRRVRRLPSLRGRAAAALLVALASLAAAACGSSASKSSATSSHGTPATAGGSATSAPSNSSGTSSVSTGPVHGTLSAVNHAPKVNQNWPYSVVVTDASGHPLSGIVDIEFVFSGRVVGRDTPPTHPVTNGRWHDYLQFPAQAVGIPLLFQAVVDTHLGSITLDWPVTVAR